MGRGGWGRVTRVGGWGGWGEGERRGEGRGEGERGGRGARQRGRGVGEGGSEWRAGLGRLGRRLVSGSTCSSRCSRLSWRHLPRAPRPPLIPCPHPMRSVPVRGAAAPWRRCHGALAVVGGVPSAASRPFCRGRGLLDGGEQLGAAEKPPRWRAAHVPTVAPLVGQRERSTCGRARRQAGDRRRRARPQAPCAVCERTHGRRADERDTSRAPAGGRPPRARGGVRRGHRLSSSTRGGTV